MYYVQACSMEKYREKYITFVLEHYSALNLPYTFPVALSFLSSPVLMNKQPFICLTEEEETVGAFGYIRGTADEQYTNRHIAQMQVAFIHEHHRGTRVFWEGLRSLAEHNAMEKEPIQEFRFWVPSGLRLQRLLGKFAVLAHTWDTQNGLLDEYRLSADKLAAYVQQTSRVAVIQDR